MFYRRHTVPIARCSDAKYVLKIVFREQGVLQRNESVECASEDDIFDSEITSSESHDKRLG